VPTKVGISCHCFASIAYSPFQNGIGKSPLIVRRPGTYGCVGSYLLHLPGFKKARMCYLPGPRLFRQMDAL